MKIFRRMSAITGMLLLLSACGSGSVNDNIRIGKGETRDGSARSVNGNIIVGSDAVLEGDVNSVNGNIELEEGAKVGNIKSVNGSIRLAERASAGKLDSVNGSVRMRPGAMSSGIRLVNGSLDAGAGAKISGDALMVNGSAELFGASIDGDIETYSGNMLVTDGSTVGGSIRIKKPTGVFDGNDKPRIVIGPDSVVEGGVVAEREINLFVHDSASVGAIEGAEAKMFSDSVSEIN